MIAPFPDTITVFAGLKRLATGTPAEIARAAKAEADRNPTARILAFEDRTGQPFELDLRGSEAEVLARLAPPAVPAGPDPAGPDPADPDVARGPGRPRLGVVAREVTLLPRHWDWLNGQPGGASVALRKLVEEARRTHERADRIRQAQETTLRFMTAMAGDQPHFEEATRALFAGEAHRFRNCIVLWPGDLYEHTARRAEAAFDGQPA